MQEIFGFITHPMELGLIWLSTEVGSAGIGIILFTVVVRLVLSPLQITQLRSARSMRDIQPQLADLRKKYGKEWAKLREAQSTLYREHNIKPLLGFLPSLLQFPILLGLYYALIHLGLSPAGYPHAVDFARSACHGLAVHNWSSWFDACYAVSGAAGGSPHIWKLFHAHFLWLSRGLGEPDPLYILPLLAGATQWVQSRMALTETDDRQQQTMNTMMHFMPLVIVLFAIRNSSGLSLYWITSTVIGILLQYRITGWGLLSVVFAGTRERDVR